QEVTHRVHEAAPEASKLLLCKTYGSVSALADQAIHARYPFLLPLGDQPRCAKVLQHLTPLCLIKGARMCGLPSLRDSSRERLQGNSSVAEAAVVVWRLSTICVSGIVQQPENLICLHEARFAKL